MLIISKSFGGRKANTDPPLNPLPTKGGEENITGQSLADGYIMLGKDNLPSRQLLLSET